MTTDEDAACVAIDVAATLLRDALPLVAMHEREADLAVAQALLWARRAQARLRGEDGEA